MVYTDRGKSRAKKDKRFFSFKVAGVREGGG